MKHEHKPKFVNIKRFQANNYLNLPQKDEEVTIITKRNNPQYVVMTASAFNLMSASDSDDFNNEEEGD